MNTPDDQPHPYAVSLPELVERLAEVDPAVAEKVIARLHPAPSTPPPPRPVALPDPVYSSWEHFLASTMESQRRAWYAKKTKVANPDRLMSGPVEHRITTDDVIAILLAARGRCHYCGTEELIDADGLVSALDALRERRDEAIRVCDEELYEISYNVAVIGSDVDVQLADFHFENVENSILEATALIKENDPYSLDQVARLTTAISDAATTPCPDGSDQRPEITSMDLPSLDSVDWEGISSQEDSVEILNEYVQVCADRIRYLLNYFSEEFRPYVVDKAKHGQFNKSEIAADCGIVSSELADAFKCWHTFPGALYNESSSSLGAMSDGLAAIESAIANQRQ